MIIILREKASDEILKKVAEDFDGVGSKCQKANGSINSSILEVIL